MTAALVFLSAMMGVVVWWLIRQSLHTSPWVEQPAAASENHAGGALSLPPAKLALGVFLCVVTSLFALLVSAYFMRMASTDWWAPELPWLLWLNTGVLALASVAVHRTRGAARRGDRAQVRSGLATGGLLTLAFLAGQYAAWLELSASGAWVAANPANAFFFLFTAIHGIHLIGGLLVWARTAARAARGVDMARLRKSVELCAVYWHYLLVLWLVLFALLLMSQRGPLNDTILDAFVCRTAAPR